MDAPRGWYGRPVTAVTILLIVLALSLFSLLGLRLGPAAEQRYSSFAVTIEHFGVDSREIERTITRPLEDELSLIPGITELRSTSEYGKARTIVLAGTGSARGAVFLRLRDAVERVYAGLPRSVQRPEIASSSVSRRPVFVAAVTAPGMGRQELLSWAESEIKPSFQKIPGVGEVEIGGGETREIHVRVDSGKAAQRGLAYQEIGLQLQRQDLLTPVGAIKGERQELPFLLSGRLGSLEALSSLSLSLPGGGTLPLSQVATVAYGAREKQSISRVDGAEAVVVSVQSSGMANLISLSRALRAEAEGWSAKGVELRTILDRGGTLEEAISHIITALLAGLLAVMVLLPLFVGELRRLLVLALSLPVVMIVTVGVLTAAGISLDEYILSGLAVGIGTVIDAGVILSEARSPRASSSLIAPLLTSVLTTLIVLVPLLFLQSVSTGIRQVAVSIGLILALSFCMSAVFVPAFCLGPGRGRGKRRVLLLSGLRVFFRTRVKRRALRAFHSLINAVIRRRLPVLAAGILLVCAMAGALLVMGKDFSPPIEDDTVFSHIEVESQATVESVDQRVSAYGREISAVPGVVSIESISRRGSAEMSVRFDSARIRRERLSRLMQAYGERIPGGFAYLPEGLTRGERALELAVIGEEEAVLKRLAYAAARELSAERWVSQVVLNFKDPPPALILKVDHEKAAELGAETADVVGALRWALRGPVALKWIEGDREIDLRVMDAEARSATRRSILRAPIAGSGGARRAVGALVEARVEAESARIYRLNRQRSVFLTLHAVNRGFDETVAGVRRALGRIDVPRGYAFELDREAVRLNQEFRLLWVALALGTFFIFVILAAASESLTAPLLILSVLPTSLAVPVLATFLLGEPIRVPVLVGLIMLSGMAVTNSILIVHELRARMRRNGRAAPAGAVGSCIHLAIRKRIRPLLITSGAAIAGTLPLLFSGARGAAFMTALSFVVLWGVLGSLLSTLLVIPALASLFPARLFRRSGAESEGSR